jgi:hypothetical protein
MELGSKYSDYRGFCEVCYTQEGQIKKCSRCEMVYYCSVVTVS